MKAKFYALALVALVGLSLIGGGFSLQKSDYNTLVSQPVITLGEYPTDISGDTELYPDAISPIKYTVDKPSVWISVYQNGTVIKITRYAGNKLTVWEKTRITPQSVSVLSDSVEKNPEVFSTHLKTSKVTGAVMMEKAASGKLNINMLQINISKEGVEKTIRVLGYTSVDEYPEPIQGIYQQILASTKNAGVYRTATAE
ncbi:MAG: hypothetical protein PHE50_01215 [Dehalococcoidales bacterium]|nr:hypothetical protein [Dehalococcoidales bacterium]